MVAIRDGRDPRTIRVEPIWGDPASRSTAQEADAATKLFSSAILSRRETLVSLGFPPEKIAEIEADIAREAALRQMLSAAPSETL